MKEFITGYRVANAVRQNEGSINLLVEGVSDNTFWRKFIRDDSLTFICHGKHNVIDAINILNADNFLYALGVVDADFDFVNYNSAQIRNLITTDFHDLEIMLIESRAYDVIMYNYANYVKLIANPEIKNHIYYLCAQLAILRYVSFVKNIGLRFKPKSTDGRPIDLNRFINKADMSFLGKKLLVDTVISYTRNNSEAHGNIVNSTDVINSMNVEEQIEVDRRQLCNGHDFIRILALTFKRLLNNYDSNQCSEDELQLSLIFAYDSIEFKKTVMYSRVRSWESINSVNVLNEGLA